MKPEDYAENIRETLRISKDEYYGHSRKQPLAFKRQIAMSLVYKNTTATLEDVAQMFGGRDYTTVIWARRVVRERMNNIIVELSESVLPFLDRT